MVKARADRRKVMLRATMHVDGPPIDVCIRDLSAHGMMLQAANPPKRGSYVEIFAGYGDVVGRVVWVGERKFGIVTRERIIVSRFLGEGGSGGGAPIRAIGRAGARQANMADAASDARLLGRSIDFSLIAAAAVFLVVLVGGIAYTILSSSMTSVSTTISH